MQNHPKFIPSWAHDKRIDALLRQEMAEHQHVISCHNKEMQTLRDCLKVAMERFDSLFNLSEQEVKDLALYVGQETTYLREKAKTNELLLAEQKNTILSLCQELHDLHLTYSSKLDVEKIKTDIDCQFKDSTRNHISSFQNLQQELKSLCTNLREDVSKMRLDMNQKFCELNDRMETNFSLSRIDKEGILKEIRVYEKSQFIIEKKIENIYTLIERINLRGSVCPKQE